MILYVYVYLHLLLFSRESDIFPKKVLFFQALQKILKLTAFICKTKKTSANPPITFSVPIRLKNKPRNKRRTVLVIKHSAWNTNSLIQQQNRLRTILNAVAHGGRAQRRTNQSANKNIWMELMERAHCRPRLDELLPSAAHMYSVGYIF